MPVAFSYQAVCHESSGCALRIQLPGRQVMWDVAFDMTPSSVNDLRAFHALTTATHTVSVHVNMSKVTRVPPLKGRRYPKLLSMLKFNIKAQVSLPWLTLFDLPSRN